ncbi:MAG: LCP family protein, partial [Chloroflexota bacterium]
MRFIGLIVLILAILVTILWAQAAQNNPEVSLSIITLIPTAIIPPGGEALLSQFSAPEQPTLTPIPSSTPDTDSNFSPPVSTPSAVVENLPTADSEFLIFPTPTVKPLAPVELVDFSTLSPDATEVFTPVETIEMPSGITNVLLIGSDSATGQDAEESARTDSLIIVSINKNYGSASVLSIPRDLYLYLPGSREARINTAYSTGNASNYPGGGVKLLKDTILFNFGIPIHYYAKIDFDGFEEIVNSIGGIEIANSCALNDWILKEPGLDIHEEDNYVQFTLEPGIHQMDGFMALWYARSRRTTSDFDRGRRQQQILGAVLDKSIDLNLMTQVPSMWKAFQDTIETDMDLGQMLQLATQANSIQENGVQHLYLTRGELESVTLVESGAEVQMLVPDISRRTFEQLYKLPALNNGSRKPISAEIINGSGQEDMGRLAQENLIWFGFQPTITEENGPLVSSTAVEYHGQNFKGSYHWLIAWMFRQERGQVT